MNTVFTANAFKPVLAPIWLSEEGYLRFESTIRQEAIDQATSLKKAFDAYSCSNLSVDSRALGPDAADIHLQCRLYQSSSPQPLLQPHRRRFTKAVPECLTEFNWKCFDLCLRFYFCTKSRRNFEAVMLRILLFLATNIAVVVAASSAAAGVEPYLQGNGLNLNALLVFFCFVFGMLEPWFHFFLSK